MLEFGQIVRTKCVGGHFLLLKKPLKFQHGYQPTWTCTDEEYPVVVCISSRESGDRFLKLISVPIPKTFEHWLFIVVHKTPYNPSLHISETPVPNWFGTRMYVRTYVLYN